ncbi:MAG: beta-lactamase family protein [Blautia sp.]|nr:beta-lactamase family protein [Blautia sp.]
MSYFEMVSPESVGIPSAAIRQFLTEAAKKGLELHRMMILRSGKCCARITWAPYDSEDLHPVYSFSKSLTATAVGFAWQEGILSLDERIMDIFPEDIPDHPSENLKACTIHHLLCMSCGQETEAADGGPEWRKAFFAHPFLHQPGTFYKYNTQGTNLLAAIIRKKTGQNVTEYLRSRLFDPLGMGEVWCWHFPDEQQTEHGGGGMKLRLDDMAKFTQFMLQDGTWEGKSLLKDWFYARAGRIQIPTAGDSEGHIKDWAQGYGYQCWMGIPDASFRADGAYGQFGLVFPRQDLCVILNAATEQTQSILDLINEYIVPSVGDALMENIDNLPEQKAQNSGAIELSLSLPVLISCRNPSFENFLQKAVYSAEDMKSSREDMEGSAEYAKSCAGLQTLVGGAGLFDLKDDGPITGIRFHFGETDVELYFSEAGREKKITAALDGRFVFSDIDGVRYASTARWRSKRRLELEIRRKDAMSGVRLILSFERERLTIQADETLMSDGNLGMTDRRIPAFYLTQDSLSALKKNSGDSDPFTPKGQSGNNPAVPK